MPVQFRDSFDRRCLRRAPNVLFLVPQDMLGAGDTGLAALRDEPNTVPIPVKRKPTTAPDAYLNDADLPILKARLREQLHHVGEQLAGGGYVVVPRQQLTTGDARYPPTAPAIDAWFACLIERMRAYGDA
jgi:hypothetical protein